MMIFRVVGLNDCIKQCLKISIVASADHMMVLHTLTLAKYGGSLLIFYCFVTVYRLDESSDCDLPLGMDHAVWD